MKYKIKTSEVPILSIKLKNALTKSVPHELDFSIKNILVNGNKRGCSGFVRNKENGVVVYVMTEVSAYGGIGYLVRYARDEKDFTGCRNRNNQYSLADIVKEVKDMLENKTEWERELISFHKCS